MGVAEAELPDVEPTPVVPDDHGFLEAEGVEEPVDIGANHARAVVTWVRRLVCVPVAAHVGSDGAEAVVGEELELVTPAVPEFGPAVTHDDGEAFASFGDVHVDAVGADGVVLDGGHGGDSIAKAVGY